MTPANARQRINVFAARIYRSRGMCSRAFQFMLDQLGVHSWSVQATQTGIGREPAGGPGLTVLLGKRRNRSTGVF